MVQRSDAAGVQPTEQSPLLSKPGQEDTYVSIAEVSPSSSLNGNGANGSVVKSRSDDEESQGTGEVEGVGLSRVARIISVLLIGNCFSRDDESIQNANQKRQASLSRMPTGPFSSPRIPSSPPSSTTLGTRAG